HPRPLSLRHDEPDLHQRRRVKTQSKRRRCLLHRVDRSADCRSTKQYGLEHKLRKIHRARSNDKTPQRGGEASEIVTLRALTLACGGRTAPRGVLLHRQQSLLSPNAPTIAAHCPVSTNYPVARDGECDAVRGAGASNRSCCCWLSDCLRHLRVRLRRAERQ